MIGTLLTLWLAQDVTLTERSVRTPVKLVCPIGKATKLVFPWPVRRLRVDRAGVDDELGLAMQQSRPVGIVLLSPQQPASGTFFVDFAGGAGRTVTFQVRTTESGAGGEVRFAWKEATPEGGPSPMPSVRAPASPKATPNAPRVERTPPPALAPPTTVATAPSPAVSPSAMPEVSPSPTGPTASGGPLDLQGMLRAESVKIGRREGRPGQRPVVLEDAIRGDRLIWLRFRVLGGAPVKVQSLTWEKGAIAAFVEEPAAKDLRVYVQLPRAEVTKKTRVELQLSDGASYRFPLSAPWLKDFLSSLF